MKRDNFWLDTLVDFRLCFAVLLDVFQKLKENYNCLGVVGEAPTNNQKMNRPLYVYI